MTEEVSIEVIPSIEMMNALGATKHTREPVVMQLPRESSVIEDDINESRDRRASTKKKPLIVIMCAIAFTAIAIAAGTGYSVYTNKNRTDTSAALSFVEDECLPPDSGAKSKVFSGNLVPTSFPTFVETTETFQKGDSTLSNDNQPLRRLRTKASSKFKIVPMKVRSLHEGKDHFVSAKCAKKAKSPPGSLSETELPPPFVDFDDSLSMSFPTDFLLCRKDPERPGFGLEDFESGFEEGEPVFSDLTSVEATDNVSKILTLTSGVAGAGGSALGAVAAVSTAFPPAAALSAGLAAISGIFLLASHLQSKNELSGTDALITNKFNELNMKMDKIALDVSQGFLDVRKDIADNELDDLMGYLQAIHNAYQDLVEATSSNNTSVGIKEAYVENYRAVCNHPFFTPLDLFRQFYGFSCGDKRDRDCATSNGDETGECKYGVKKRQYIRDIYEGIAEGLATRYLPFGTWLLKAMVLAQFHFEMCLPRDRLTCDDPTTDPVRKHNAEEMKNATEEVEANLNNTLNCISTGFRDTLSDKNFYLKKVPDIEKCFEMKNEDGGEAKPENMNECMAEKTVAILSKEFKTKHWAVVVYNEQGPANQGRDIEKDQCDKTYEYGCINLKVEDLRGRFFHLMYRETSKGRKNYLHNTDKSNGGDLPIAGLSEAENDVFDGIHDGLVKYGVVTDCIGDPLQPTDDPMGHIKVLSREHGYIAIKTGNGTPSGAFFSNPMMFRQVDVKYTETISISGEKCDMQSYNLGPCRSNCPDIVLTSLCPTDCPQIWMVA